MAKHCEFLAGSAATLGLAAPAVQAAGDTKLLKFIPQADIALLDPHFASALVTRNHAKREMFRAGELPDDMVAELEASLDKYSGGPED